MGNLSLEKRILNHLWDKDSSKDELTEIFGDITKAIDNLILFRIVKVAYDVLSIYCPVGAGKKKKFLTKTSTSLEDVLKLFDTRKSSYKSFSSYTTYDDSEGRGSSEAWKRASQFLLGEVIESSVYLKILGFSHRPETLGELRKKYLKLIKKEHPDAGGDPKKAEKIINAYRILKKTY